MIDKHINSLIAEACGWTHVLRDHGVGKCPVATYIGNERVPNYCNDLNVMHDAEEHLLGDSWIGYMNQLADIEGSLFGIRATARQRAEAFLRALGKWEEA